MRAPAAIFASLIALALAIVPLASGEDESSAAHWVELAREAGQNCKAGELDRAAEALDALAVDLSGAIGRDHDAVALVEIARSQVTRALGQSPTPLPASDSEAGELAPEVAEAFSSLRACTRVRLPKPSSELLDPSLQAEAMPSALPGGDFATQLEAARGLARKGQYEAAARAARRAEALSRAEADPTARANAASTLALLQLQVGDFEQAAKSARQADRAAARASDPLTRIAMARLFTAMRHLEKASEILDASEAAAAGDPAVAAELAEARGDFALALGAPGRAIDAFDFAVEGHRERYGTEHPSTASVLQLRGQAHRMAGDLPAAQRDLREALEIRERRYGAAHPEAARTRNALGIVLADLGDWVRADAVFGEALEALDRELGKRHPEVITVRANRVLVEWGREESEVEAFHYAAILDGLVATYGEDHPVASEARRNLARMQEVLGDAEAAEALLDAALASQTRSLGAGHPSLARTRMARGRFFARAGRYSEAHRELTAAVDGLRAHHGDEHPLVARARTARAQVATALGRGGEAWSDAREAARVFDLYLQRSFGAMPDRQRVLLAADAARVVGALASLDARGVADARAVYAALIPQRDAVLRSIATDQRRRRSEAAESFETLRQLRERYVAAVLSDGAEAAARGRELAEAIDAEESVLGLTRGGMRERDASEILHAACQRMPRDAALIEYVAYDRVQRRAASARHGLDPRPHYLAMVVRPQGGAGSARECAVDRIDLGPAAPIDEAADRFATAMQEQRGDDAAARAALSRLVLMPLEKTLGQSANWWVIPDASLWGVPFAALPDPASKDGRYLAERVVLGTLTSIHELADIQAEARVAAGPTLLFGAPEFGSREAGAGPRVLTASGPCRMNPFEPLPGTVQELETLAALLPNARVVAGSDAGKRRLLRELEARPSVVHLATHAYFAGFAARDAGCGSEMPERDRELALGRSTVVPNPLLLSGIALAGANDPEATANDGSVGGILTALEASGLDLSAARLVVLSACDTGAGLHHRGQEVQGLRFGFRASGADSLLTSLWRSNDVVTRKLMHDFYSALRTNGASGDDLFQGPRALRAAQLARIESERRLGLTKPLTWANFVFSGVY